MKRLSYMIRGLAWIVYLIVILAILMAAPSLFGHKPIIVLSSGMESVYPVGSVTYYRKASFEDIAVGDVITFQIGNDSSATHRVTAINGTEQSFTTRGDSNDTEDADPVMFSSVKGKTDSLAVPFAGYLISFMQRWYVIAVCGVILFLDLLRGYDKERARGDF